MARRTKWVRPTIKELIAQIYDSFEKDTRTDGKEFYKLKADAPHWLSNEYRFMNKMHEALDDRLPDDWVYEATRDIALNLSDYGDDDSTIEYFRDKMSEIARDMVDVYNSDLTAWLASHLYNIALVDEALEDFGFDKDSGIISAISIGQERAYERIGDALLSAVEAEDESPTMSA